MGFLSSIWSLWKKTEASGLLIGLFKSKHHHFLSSDGETIEKIAMDAVNKAFDKYPDVFNGHFGQRPFKLTTAFVGLSILLDTLNVRNKNFNFLMMSLLELYKEIEVNQNFYPFKSMDFQIIDMVVPSIEKKQQEWEVEFGELSNSIQKFMNSK